MAANPLSVDPECQQFVSLLIKQSAEDNFGFSQRQVRNIQSSVEGFSLWQKVSESSTNGRFDFSVFSRQLCNPEFEKVRGCFKSAKITYPGVDARSVCYREVWDLCKRIEYVWTDLSRHSMDTSSLG